LLPGCHLNTQSISFANSMSLYPPRNRCVAVSLVGIRPTRGELMGGHGGITARVVAAEEIALGDDFPTNMTPDQTFPSHHPNSNLASNGLKTSKGTGK